ncbi:hypothetical protein NKH18_49295 [Streptomyces sp. M10(2022)]
MHCVRRAVMPPLLLLAALLGAAFTAWSTAAVTLGWLLAGLVCGLTGVALVAARGVRTAAGTVQVAAEERRTAELTAVAGLRRPSRSRCSGLRTSCAEGHGRRCRKCRCRSRPV